MRWVESWEIPSTDGKRFYKVSRADDGTYGCDCPVWKFKRVDCKHILKVMRDGKRGAEVEMAGEPVEATPLRERPKKPSAPPEAPAPDPIIATLSNIRAAAKWR